MEWTSTKLHNIGSHVLPVSKGSRESGTTEQEKTVLSPFEFLSRRRRLWRSQVALVDFLGVSAPTPFIAQTECRRSSKCSKRALASCTTTPASATDAIFKALDPLDAYFMMLANTLKVYLQSPKTQVNDQKELTLLERTFHYLWSNFCFVMLVNLAL